MEAKFRERGEREEQLIKAKEKLENDIAEIMKMSGDNSSQLTKMNDELRLKERNVEELQLKLTKANESVSFLQRSIGEVTLKAEASQQEASKKHEKEKEELLNKLSDLEKKMEMSHNQCRDLKARYEEANSETQAKHKEDLQNLQKVLLETGESLKAARKENSDLLQEIVELKKQADKAKVCHGRELRGCSSWLGFCAGPGGCLESSSMWDEPSRPLHALTCQGSGRVPNHVSCGFRCSVPAAVPPQGW